MADDFTVIQWWKDQPVGALLLFEDEEGQYTVVIVYPPKRGQYHKMIYRFRLISLYRVDYSDELKSHDYMGHIGRSEGFPMAVKGKSQRSLTNLGFLLFTGTTPRECVRRHINKSIQSLNRQREEQEKLWEHVKETKVEKETV